MALSNYPTKTKYAYLDEVFALIDGVITQLVVAGWRVVVDYDTDGVTGRQRTYYSFSTIAKEIVEEKVYASENHLLSMLKGNYFNIDFDQGTGVAGLLGGHNNYNNLASAPDNGYWTDLAGFSFANVNFLLPSIEKPFVGRVSGTSGSPVLTGSGTAFETFVDGEEGTTIKIGNETKVISSVDSDTQITLTTNLASNHTSEIMVLVKTAHEVTFKYYDGELSNKLLVFDNTDLEGATLPVGIDTKAEFKAAVKSYDKETTIWTDGNPIGE